MQKKKCIYKKESCADFILNFNFNLNIGGTTVNWSACLKVINVNVSTTILYILIWFYYYLYIH